METNNDEVICPNCCNQFRAIPINVQQRIAALKAELAELRGKVRDAYLSGYEKGHEDTVEGCYSPEQSTDDFMEEMRQAAQEGK